MCKECGCGASGNNTRLQFIVNGYTEDSAKAMEKKLLGMPGVMYVHIHAHDGETTVDYAPVENKADADHGRFRGRRPDGKPVKKNRRPFGPPIFVGTFRTYQ